MDNDYSKNKTMRGRANMPASLKYRVSIADPTDNGSVMDMDRPVSPMSPYVDTTANWDSVKKQGSLSGGK